MRIGVFCPNWVGDAVIALHFFNACRHKNPDATILAICKSWVAPIFENHPAIDGIVSFEKRDLSGLKATRNTGRNLRKLDLDRFYLLSNSFRSAYLAWKSETVYCAGFPGQGRTILLSHVIARPSKPVHRSQNYIHLLNLKDNTSEFEKGVICLSGGEKKWAQNKLKQLDLERPVALFPFSVATSRSIPQVKMLEILDTTNEPILIFGGKGDQQKGEILVSASNKKNIRSVVGMYGLRKSMALISQCRGALATDSGLGHISANLGVPTVSLFGAGDSTYTGPIGPHTKIVNENVYCSPCLKNKCKNRKEHLLCFEAIKSEIPFAALSVLISNQKNGQV
ncbi:lipopolysaccharide heptosyltransferase II [Caldithrix abyssi]|nr:lipopolysaccharide heptosyltransferase II [Caldithrix abyssi]